jgi:thiamine-monophosphate kinase
VLYEKQLPISSVTRQVAAERQEEATDLALYGGEDYELLLAIPPDRIVAAIDAAGSVALHAVGLVLDERDGISLERADGRRVELAARGWQHF